MMMIHNSQKNEYEVFDLNLEVVVVVVVVVVVDVVAVVDVVDAVGVVVDVVLLVGVGGRGLVRLCSCWLLLLLMTLPDLHLD